MHVEAAAQETGRQPFHGEAGEQVGRGAMDAEGGIIARSKIKYEFCATGLEAGER